MAAPKGTKAREMQAPFKGMAPPPKKIIRKGVK